jgi:hypothetical protein
MKSKLCADPGVDAVKEEERIEFTIARCAIDNSSLDRGPLPPSKKESLLNLEYRASSAR